jgi:hypothetical protein
MEGIRIELVGEADLEELLPLMRGYCDFYEVAPSDEALLRMSRALIADPERVRRAGLERANMFTWPKTARLTIAAYESLLRKRG